ncbi:PAS domain S-box protein [Telmatospirillum sp.]|uniref:PAS domain S-box protein n=1 Tax=Telmatospirillum sp. TaxID=2079197 RepID=UPI00284EAD6C|nr:PAS domain S-box protein [Telmatospirillum sp.]MDR3436201.1 PAS domain S-box protein [Telmatospirillum sp.]
MQKSNERGYFLATVPATAFDRRTALVVVSMSAILFLAVIPFASAKLPQFPAFIGIYQFVLSVIDLFTVVFLLVQFSVLQLRSLLILACGYFFTAFLAIVHALTFPGLFGPSGLLPTGGQTTVWLYMFWHAGFPLLTIAYAFAKDEPTEGRLRVSTLRAATLSLTCVAVVAGLLAYVATALHDFLPVLLSEGRYTPVMDGVVSSVWALNLVAVLILWRRRPHSILDVWLMVVLCAWICDIGLSAVFNTARFDLGFYVGRIYGLVAATLVLTVLLIETGVLQTELARLLGVVSEHAEEMRKRHGEREQLFSAIIESSNDAIVTETLDGMITAWNPAAERLFGYSANEMVGESLDIITPFDRRHETREILARVGRGERIMLFETQRLHRDGTCLDISLSISPLWSSSGEIVGASKTARDITESNRTRRALQDSEQLARKIVDTALDAFIQMDDAGLITDWNSQAEILFGWSRHEAIGQRLGDLIVAEAHRAGHADGLARFLATGESRILGRRVELDALRRDGKEIKVELSVTALERGQGFIFNGFVRDLTDKIAAEERLREAQKMDAIGQLTGGVAHDFNNILTVITGTIGILTRAVEKDEQMAKIARMISTAADRGAELTRHLLAFARRQPLQPRETDVNALIVDTARLLRPTLGEQIAIDVSLDDQASHALVDPSQLTTALLNLAINARDAMPGGGKLLFETRNVHLDEHYASEHTEVQPGPYVMVAVSDTGTGIPAEILSKVFEPFFTSKGPGKGTGLGLSMVYGFVKQSAGHIMIYSEEGHGTTVKLYLPLATEASDLTEEDPWPDEGSDGEMILVVEDDALVRHLVMAQLKDLGYRALACEDAAEAMAVIDTGQDIDLLFTDVVIRGPMNGRQLVDEVARRRPGCKFLFTSGYTEDALIRHGRLDPGILLLTKPYRRADLASMLRRALDG